MALRFLDEMVFLMNQFLRLTPQTVWEDHTHYSCKWRSTAWQWHGTFTINESALPVQTTLSTACRDVSFSNWAIYHTEVASNSSNKFTAAKFTLVNSNLRKLGHDSAANLKISKPLMRMSWSSSVKSDRIKFFEWAKK